MDIDNPCFGKSCNDCETCIYDMDIDDMNNCGQFVKCYSGANCDTCVDRDTESSDKMTSCEKCPKLVKNYLDDSCLAFSAHCDGVKIWCNNSYYPRLLKAKTGPMLPIETPEWCPINKGVDEQILKPINQETSSQEKDVELVEPKIKSVKEMSYSEKREALGKLPRHIDWDDIKENDIFVVPKILTQSRKVVKIVTKADNLLRCSEINEYGKESNYLTTIFKNDIDAVFITKIHRF